MSKKTKAVKVVNPIGYKVLRKIGQKLMSSSSKFLKVQYISGKFVKPRTYGGPLAVFTSKYQAIGSIEKLDHKGQMRVYRCEYIPTTANLLFRFAEGGLQTKELDTCPMGTVLARKVKLLKKIF